MLVSIELKIITYLIDMLKGLQKMGIKFDGTNVKNGSKIIANMKRSNELREGSSSGGRAQMITLDLLL